MKMDGFPLDFAMDRGVSRSFSLHLPRVRGAGLPLERRERGSGGSAAAGGRQGPLGRLRRELLRRSPSKRGFQVAAILPLLSMYN